MDLALPVINVGPGTTVRVKQLLEPTSSEGRPVSELTGIKAGRAGPTSSVSYGAAEVLVTAKEVAARAIEAAVAFKDKAGINTASMKAAALFIATNA